MTRSKLLLVCGALLLTLATAATADDKILLGVPNAPVDGRHDPLWNVCDGAWREVQTASSEGRLLAASLRSESGRARMRCLLGAINDLRTANGAAYDRAAAAMRVELLVGVAGADGLDFFADQVDSQPPVVAATLNSTLLRRGHPEAFRRYFNFRREKLARGETWPRDNAATPSIFADLIGRGRCAMPTCSAQLPQTLALIEANLDLVELELRGLEESLVPSSDESLRRNVRAVRELAGRVRSGAAAMGAAADNRSANH